MNRAPRFDVTTLGEAMLRLSVPAGMRLEVADRLDMRPGGAEANLAVALSRVERCTAWIGGLPNNPLGHNLANHLRVAGVDLDGVVWCDTGRVGTYYVEFSAPPRATQVIYDRADSCAARLTPDEINWDYLLDTRLLHLTGITPPLSTGCREIVELAIQHARVRQIPVSFDVNYRQKLWSEQDAARFIKPLVQGIELFFCGRSDATRVMGVEGSPEAMVKQLHDMTGAKTVVMSLAERGAIAYDGRELLHEPAKPVKIIDRPGAGDGLAAGVIYGWLADDLRLGLQTGVVLAALALSQHGDMIVTTPAEVASLIEASSATLIR